MPKMLTVYEVTSRFFNDGKSTAQITNVFTASTLPDKVFTILDLYDEYLDYYTNTEEADKHLSS